MSGKQTNIKRTSTPYLALFDLDRTIFSVNSGNYLVWHAFRKNLISVLSLIKGIYLAFLYRTGWRETKKILNEMTSWIKGISETELNLIAEELIKRKLLQKIRPQIYKEVEKHRHKGAHVVILSAALPVLCHPIAFHLKMDDVICSKLESYQGIFTGKPLGMICYGEEKLKRLISYCRSNNFNIAESYYYADSISDIHVLSSVGYPICIDPDRKLRNTAKKNNWLIPDWQ